MSKTQPVGDTPQDPAGDKTEPVRIPDIPSPQPPYQPPYQQPQPPYQQPQPPYQPPYQQPQPPYQPPYQQPYQPPYQQPYHMPVATPGPLARLSLGRKVLLAAAVLALISFLLPWYYFGEGTIDRDALEEMSQRRAEETFEATSDLFGRTAANRVANSGGEISTGGLHGIWAFLSFLALLVAGVAAALPLAGRRLRDLVPLPLPESLIVLGLLGVALLFALLSVLILNNPFISIGFGFYLTLLALLAAAGGAAMLLTSGE